MLNSLNPILEFSTIRDVKVGHTIKHGSLKKEHDLIGAIWNSHPSISNNIDMIFNNTI